MNTTIQRPAVYEDLFALPDKYGREIINGQIITQPRPSPRLSRAGLALGGMIINRFDRDSTDGPGGWWIFAGPECHLDADVVVPDIAGWRHSTMPDFPDSAWIDITPDWVCEIVSPSTQKYDRSTKYWIVDPIDRLIEVFALENGKWTLLHTGMALI
jgi:Uma2 family endonuclease